MRIQKNKDADGNVNGYTMWLSANDTYNWAHRPRNDWPCSTLSHKRCVVRVDDNGLFDLTVNGRDDDDVDGVELDAIVGDHLPKDCRHLWPIWGETE
jgi:hypothetical protein